MAKFSLVPRDARFNRLLDQAASTAHDAAQSLHGMLVSYPAKRELQLQRIRQLKHQGDDQLRGMVRLLSQTFVTPFDQRDLYALARAIDRVVDHTDEGAAMFDIYQVEAVTPTALAMTEQLVVATRELASAVAELDHPERIEVHGQRVHACEDAADELLRQGIREAFAAMWDEAAVIICWKDIYTQFEEAVDACEDAATVLEQIGVKHS